MSKPEDCDLSKTIYTITFDLVQALALERDSFKNHIQRLDRDISALRGQNETTLQPHDQPMQARKSGGVLSERSETTYLHIIGGMLTLLLGRNSAGQPYSTFTTQEAVIHTLMEHHGNLSGISERTLLAKFAAAKRSLARD